METEAKFTIPDSAALDHLREQAQIGPYTRGDVEVKHDQDRYVDTADRRFMQEGWAVRLRNRNGALLLTLKGLNNAPSGAIHSREEYQVAVEGLDPDTWPDGTVRDMVRDIAGAAPLADLVALAQTRHVAILRDGERQVAEWSLDAVTIAGPDGTEQIYELEAELLPDGTPDDLAVISEVCSKEYGLAAQPLSKLERALQVVRQEAPSRGVPTTPLAITPRQRQTAPLSVIPAGTAPLPVVPASSGKKSGAGLLPTDPMTTATRKLLHVQYNAMRAHEEGTHSGDDIEALHDMRVATRRMRALLRVAGPYLTGRKVDRVRRDVRAIAQTLGAVRDLDVLIEHAQKFRAGQAGNEQADVDSLINAWCADRDRARTRLVRLLDSRAYGQAKDRLKLFIQSTESAPDREAEVVPTQVRHVAGGILWTHYEAVRAYETVMAGPTVTQLHALRIHGKYLRYTLEFFSEVLPGDAPALIRDVTQMQDQLGALHDADVAAGLIRDYLAAHAPKAKKHHPAPPPPPGLAAYLVERESAVHTLAAAFGPTWITLTDPAWRTRLAGAIAAL